MRCQSQKVASFSLSKIKVNKQKIFWVSLFQHQNFHENTNFKFHKAACVDALFRWSGKHPQHSVANTFRTISTSESARFRRRCDKTPGAPSGSQLQPLPAYKTRTPNSTRQHGDNIQASWKTSKLLYHKLIQDNAYRILPESTGFRGRHDKTYWLLFFGWLSAAFAQASTLILLNEKDASFWLWQY